MKNRIMTLLLSLSMITGGAAVPSTQVYAFEGYTAEASQEEADIDQKNADTSEESADYLQESAEEAGESTAREQEEELLEDEEANVSSSESISVDEDHFPDAAFRAIIKEYAGKSLEASEIAGLTELDLSQKTVAATTDCDGVKDLTGLEYLTELRSLDISGNKLTKLDISQNTKLTSLSCDGNQLLSLDVSHSQLSEGESFMMSENSQSLTVTADEEGHIDLASLDEGIDPQKIENLEGADLDGSVLTNISDSKVTYRYLAGHGVYLYVVLQLASSQAPASPTPSLTPTPSITATPTPTAVYASGVIILYNGKNTASTTMKSGTSIQLTANVTPANATTKGVTWSSADSSIATVSSSGKVTAKKEGSVLITAKSKDGKKANRISITVLAKGIPGVPTVTKKSTRCKNGNIAFEWTPVSGASGYYVYYKTSNGAWITTKMEGQYNTVYRNRHGIPGNTYQYRVAAYNSAGTGAKSELRSYTCQLSMPKIKKISASYLYWEEVDGATAYKVYCRSSAKGSWNYVGKTKETKKKISYHKNWYYTVKAVKGTLESDYDKTFTYKYKTTKKKILFDGDSVTAGSAAGAYISWAERAASLLGYSCENRAYDGSRIISTTKNTAKSVVMRSTDLGFKGYDVIVLAVGSNDYGHNTKMGTINSSNTRTFYGAWNKVLSTIKKQNPKAKVILAAPIERKWVGVHDYNKCGYSTENDLGYTLADYAAAMKDLAKKWNVNFYDANATGVLTQENVASKTFDNCHPLPSTQVELADAFVNYYRKNIL